MTEVLTEDVLRLIIDRKVNGDLADAVLECDDLDGLLSVCRTISGGDDAAVGMELSDIDDSLRGSARNRVLDAESPGDAFAEVIRQYRAAIQ